MTAVSASQNAATAVVLISCPDRPGLVAAVANFIADHGGNIVAADQYTDPDERVFFQRVEFELNGLDLSRDQLGTAFAEVARRFSMQTSVRFSDERFKVAILASKEPHCLVDLLGRARVGEYPTAEIAVVIANHPDHEDTARFYGIPFVHLPVNAATKADQERQVLGSLRSHQVELVVLARYMQILSEEFVALYPNQIINIHHSFLPAFMGARPYHQAHARGVKIIGVTAHYATSDLDEGPIIGQDVVHVSHRDAVSDLVRKGRDLEKVVLGRSIRLHLEHRVLVHGNKTVVFA